MRNRLRRILDVWPETVRNPVALKVAGRGATRATPFRGVDALGVAHRGGCG